MHFGSRPAEPKPGTTKQKLRKTTNGEIIRMVIDPNGKMTEEQEIILMRTIGSYASDAVKDHA